MVLVPGAANQELALEVHANRQLRALREVGEVVPYEIDRLLPWAITDNGDVLFWRVEGEPVDWTVVINEGRGPEWHAFAGGALAWLVAWLAGRGEGEPAAAPAPGRHLQRGRNNSSSAGEIVRSWRPSSRRIDNSC